MSVKSFQICFDTIKEFVEKREPFSHSELVDRIVENGGIPRLGVRTNLSEYMERLEERGKLFYNEYSEKYDFLTK